MIQIFGIVQWLMNKFASLLTRYGMEMFLACDAKPICELQQREFWSWLIPSERIVLG